MRYATAKKSARADKARDVVVPRLRSAIPGNQIQLRRLQAKPQGDAVGTGGPQGATQQNDAPAGIPPSLDMPAFPCERDGIVLCNTVTGSMQAPNFPDCWNASTAIIDSCKGDKSRCLARAKCALCECLGKNYCVCTGIV